MVVAKVEAEARVKETSIVRALMGPLCSMPVGFCVSLATSHDPLKAQGLTTFERVWQHRQAHVEDRVRTLSTGSCAQTVAPPVL
jgi:hypothetical protein